MTKFLRLLLPSLFILQVIVSSGFELAHDESYYWLYSRNLDWGYFDHPPLVAAIIRAFSFLPHTEWGIRFGFVLLQFGALFFLLKMLEARFWDRAMLLYFSFPLASFTGLLALPDIPLLLMTALYCWCLKVYLERREVLAGLLLALIIALLLYAKYHGILLVFFTVVALPGLLKERNFYLIACVAVLLFLPHVWWQYQHDFATLRYHFIERPSSAFSLNRSLEYLGVQVLLAGVFAGPIVWWTVIKKKTSNEFDRAMKFISVGVAVFFLISTISKKFEANWTISLAVPLIYLSARLDTWERKYARFLLYVSFLLVVVARLLFLFPPETLGLRRLKEFNGWESWAKSIRNECGDLPIMANSYQIASKLSFYLLEDVHSLNYQSRKNQFDFWSWRLEKPINEVCYLTDAREFTGDTVTTPEGKSLQMIKNQSYADLLSRKEASMR